MSYIAHPGQNRDTGRFIRGSIDQYARRSIFRKAGLMCERFLNDVFYFLKVRTCFDGQRDLYSYPPGPYRPVDHLPRQQVAIWHDDLGPFFRHDLARANANVADDTFFIVEFYKVS